MPRGQSIAATETINAQGKAQVLVEDWRIDYNNHRPHSAHGGQAPAEFAANWTIHNQPKAA